MFKRKLVKTLKNTINNLEQELKEEKTRNEIYQKDMVILLKNSEKQRKKIKDLENNIELLVNNLSEKNKELISDDQSEN